MKIEPYRLEKHEAEKLRTVIALFGRVFEDPENYQLHPPSNDYLRSFLTDRNNIVLVADDNGAIVGGLVAYVLTKFERERSEVYLYDLAVESDLQRRGIGSLLMEELRRFSKDIGADTVFVQADAKDAAVHFYRSLHPVADLATRNFDFNV